MASPASTTRAGAAPRPGRAASPGEGMRPAITRAFSGRLTLRRPYSDDELVNRRTAFARPRLARPVVVILAVATLLTGIVALNVAALRQRMQADDLDTRIALLRDERRQLETDLSRAGAVGKIEFAAHKNLGLVAPASGDVEYLKLPTRRSENP
jgi:hypothetical protein